jgi:hypothetical protein
MTYFLPLQASVLGQAQARRSPAKPADSQTATSGSDTWSSSEGESDSDDIDSEVSSRVRGRGTRQVRRQQPRAGLEHQQFARASESTAHAAVAAARPARLALPAQRGPTLHTPYSHLLWCHMSLQVYSTVCIASALCTDIEDLHSANASCSVQVSFLKHPADWDIKGYILQHPVMQQQAAVQPSDSTVGSTNASQSLEPFEATLKRRTTGALWVKGLSAQSIMQSLEWDGAPHNVVLQERVRWCNCHQKCHRNRMPCICPWQYDRVLSSVERVSCWMAFHCVLALLSSGSQWLWQG